MKKDAFFIDIDFDFELFGLTSPEKEYKVAWWLNRSLGIHLSNDEPIELNFLKGKSLKVLRYSFKTAHTYIYLIKNKGFEYVNYAKPYLIPELQQYDYLLMVKDEVDMYNLIELEESINAIPIVQLFKKIEINSLQSKENLIFE
jgi:hypothetical protein